MTRLIICFSLFIFSINTFHAQGNNEAFNDQLAKAEKALLDKDLGKVKTILSSQPLKSKQNNPKIKQLTTKVTVLETIINGGNHISSEKWEDAIIEADKGLFFIQSNMSLFVGTEKQELEKIKLDAENGKKGIKSSSSTVSNGARLDDLGDPIDYKTGRDQMMKTYSDERNAPYIEFERNKDTMIQENQRREKIIIQGISQNQKSIDSSQVKMEKEKEKSIQSIDQNRKEYFSQRDEVIKSAADKKNTIAEEVKESNKKTEKDLASINKTNKDRVDLINDDIDSSASKRLKFREENNKGNEKRIELISNDQKKYDSLAQIAKVSRTDASNNNAQLVADNLKSLDKHRQSEPIKTTGSGLVNNKGIPYEKGVTQGVFSKGEKGKTQVLITRRVKIDEKNNADVYLRHESPSSVTTYTKNGATITEYTWNIESGNVTHWE
jgi:hypothetical protein